MSAESHCDTEKTVPPAAATHEEEEEHVRVAVLHQPRALPS